MLRILAYVVAALILVVNYAYGAYEGPLPADPMKSGKGIWQIDEAKAVWLVDGDRNSELGKLLGKWKQCGKVTWEFAESQNTVWAICDAKQTLAAYNPELITAIRSYKPDSDMTYVQFKEYRWLIPIAIHPMNGSAVLGFPYFQAVWSDNHTLTLGGENYDFQAVTKALLKNRTLEKPAKDHPAHVFYLWAEKMYMQPSDWQPYE
jgi:hypothetical protein